METRSRRPLPARPARGFVRSDWTNAARDRTASQRPPLRLAIVPGVAVVSNCPSCTTARVISGAAGNETSGTPFSLSRIQIHTLQDKNEGKVMYLKIAFAVIVLAASLSSAQACSPWDPRCYEHHTGHHHHSVHHKTHHHHAHHHQA
jgi:hypothetical protein